MLFTTVFFSVFWYMSADDEYTPWLAGLSMKHSNTHFKSLICFSVKLAILERCAAMAMVTWFGWLSLSSFLVSRVIWMKLWYHFTTAISVLCGEEFRSPIRISAYSFSYVEENLKPSMAFVLGVLLPSALHDLVAQLHPWQWCLWWSLLRYSGLQAYIVR